MLKCDVGYDRPPEYQTPRVEEINMPRNTEEYDIAIEEKQVNMAEYASAQWSKYVDGTFVALFTQVIHFALVCGVAISNEAYYYNNDTGESTFDRPLAYVTPKAEHEKFWEDSNRLQLLDDPQYPDPIHGTF